MLDKNTFGSSLCATILVDMLNKNNDKKVNAKVSKFISENNKVISSIAQIQDEKSRKLIYKLYKESLSLNKQKLIVPEMIYTYCLNVLITKLRKEVKL